jgi:hypothetical protein
MDIFEEAMIPLGESGILWIWQDPIDDVRFSKDPHFSEKVGDWVLLPKLPNRRQSKDYEAHTVFLHADKSTMPNWGRV